MGGSNLRSRAVLLAATALASLALAVPAGAQPYDDQLIFLTFDENTALSGEFEIGGPIRFGGANFPPDTDYIAELEQNPTEVLKTFRTDSAGIFLEDATIPTTFREGPATLRARPRQAGAGPTATRVIALTAARVTPTPTPAPGPKLPTTGTDAAVLGVWGAAFLAGGLGLVTFTRRRREIAAVPVPTGPTDPSKLPLDRIHWVAWEEEMAAWEARRSLSSHNS